MLSNESNEKLSFKINVFAFDRDYNVKDYSETLTKTQVERLKDLSEKMYDDKGLELIILIFNEGYNDSQLKCYAYDYFDTSGSDAISCTLYF